MANNGVHIAKLWDATTPGGEVLLAQATFTGETASGEQFVAVQWLLQAGVEYFVGVTMPNGHYGTTTSFFTGAVTRDVITALAGKSAFGFGTSFPDNTTTTSYGVSCRWVNSNWRKIAAF